jgi:hypothetical protein
LQLWYVYESQMRVFWHVINTCPIHNMLVVSSVEKFTQIYTSYREEGLFKKCIKHTTTYIQTQCNIFSNFKVIMPRTCNKKKGCHTCSNSTHFFTNLFSAFFWTFYFYFLHRKNYFILTDGHQVSQTQPISIRAKTLLNIWTGAAYKEKQKMCIRTLPSRCFLGPAIFITISPCPPPLHFFLRSLLFSGQFS